MSQKVRRANGATFPPHLFQAASWVMFIFFLGTYYALFNAYLQTDAATGVGILFAFFATSTFISAAVATLTDPADKNIYIPENAYEGKELPRGLLYCYRCEKHVQETSKHCVVCHKCVDAFDHHCVWLNNCVGIHNYMSFITSLIAATGLMAVQICVGIYLLSEYGNHRADFDRRVAALYPSLAPEAFIGLTTAVSIIDSLTLALIIQLLAFHSYLIDHDITTYDFVMARSRLDYDAEDEEAGCTKCEQDCKGGSKADSCKPAAAGQDCCKPDPSGPPRDCRDPDTQCTVRKPKHRPNYTGKGSVISIWKGRQAAGDLDGLAASRASLAAGVELPDLRSAKGGPSAGASAPHMSEGGGGGAAGSGAAGANLQASASSRPEEEGGRPGSASTTRGISLGLAEAGAAAGGGVVQDWVTRKSGPPPPPAPVGNTSNSSSSSSSSPASSRGRGSPGSSSSPGGSEAAAAAAAGGREMKEEDEALAKGGAVEEVDEAEEDSSLDIDPTTVAELGLAGGVTHASSPPAAAPPTGSSSSRDRVSGAVGGRGSARHADLDLRLAERTVTDGAGLDNARYTAAALGVTEAEAGDLTVVSVSGSASESVGAPTPARGAVPGMLSPAGSVHGGGRRVLNVDDVAAGGGEEEGVEEQVTVVGEEEETHTSTDGKAVYIA